MRRCSTRRTTARRSASAAALRRQGSWGISYPSVRDAEGECVAIFRPRALRHAKSALHIALHWDGERITHWFEKRAPHPLTTRLNRDVAPPRGGRRDCLQMRQLLATVPVPGGYPRSASPCREKFVNR